MSLMRNAVSSNCQSHLKLSEKNILWPRFLSTACFIAKKNFTGARLDGFTSSRALGVALIPLMAIVPVVYGVIHLLSALGIAFPTEVEHLLWNISCYILVGVPVGLAILLVLLETGERQRLEFAELCYSQMKYFVEDFPKFSPGMVIWRVTELYEIGTSDLRLRIKFIRRSTLLSMCAILYAASIVYIAARLYIVIESFISLRHVPIGIYDTPLLNVMNYVPHL